MNKRPHCSWQGSDWGAFGPLTPFYGPSWPHCGETLSQLARSVKILGGSLQFKFALELGQNPDRIKAWFLTAFELQKRNHFRGFE